ncbi:MAG: ATP-binding protein [Bacteroidales bacterium]|jgi:AAA15 family ATPase/GTPase|nr:ATP-binding protein [Bacteroidales bacterium]HPB35163.1 ATP-binding protein [Bacteroidales bacterium]
MIEEFSFENYKSFKEMNTLNMTAAKLKSKYSRVDVDPTIQLDDDVTLLKSKAIYGANASGKSNIVKAFGSFIRIVQHSVKDEQILEKHMAPFFLSTETFDKPVFMQLVFRCEGVRYRYGFQADKEKIHSEWLYATPGKREQSFFIRDNDTLNSINKKNFPEGDMVMKLIDNEKGNTIFRKNSLFLTSLAAFGVGKISKMLLNEISRFMVIDGLKHRGAFEQTTAMLELPGMKKLVQTFLSMADAGVNDLDTIDLSDETVGESSNLDKKRKIVVALKDVYDADYKLITKMPFPLSLFESEGTNKMYEISTFIINALRQGRVLVIDEFDARFHPLITRKIVELFNSPGNKNGQLIFVTHDTNLLSADLLRRDQIDFVEKDAYGASHLYTLVQFKGIRDTDPFEKNYIKGKYGAIPFVGGLNNLFAHFEDAEA